MKKIIKLNIFLLFLSSFKFISCHKHYNHEHNKNKISEVFSWKQISYDFDGIIYSNSTDRAYHAPGPALPDDQKFFIQRNNVPIGFEVYKDKVFVTVPRRRYGIPSTLNYIPIGAAPYLKPYPDVDSIDQFVSVYRPRVDVCGRLWMVDTGLLEVPGARKQVRPPAIIIYDLKTDTQVLKHELNPSVLVSERTTGGLTSITVDVDHSSCDNAFAYINDLATEGLVVFSLRQRASWRVDHPTFRHDEAAINFTSSGQLINWKDGLFSLAIAERDCGRQLIYHPLVSTQEFALDPALLRKRQSLAAVDPLLGNRGPNTQSGSHDFHAPSSAMFYANVAQAGILCWNVNSDVTPANFVLVAKDEDKMGYISDLKVKGNDVWFLSNQIPKFVFNTQNVNDYNYFIMRGSAHQLIKGTICDNNYQEHDHVWE